MQGSPQVRASDEQREGTVRHLREHFAAGRLNEEELTERVERAYGARTAGELDALTSDLPELPLSPEERKAALVARRAQLQRRLIQETGGGIGLFVICTVIWAASGAHRGSFWPIWVLVFVVLPVIRNGWRLYGPAPQLDRVERELERRSRRGDRNRSRHGDRHRHRHGGRY